MQPEPIDLFLPEVFESEFPHDYFRWLRTNDPIHWNPGRPARERAPGVVDPEQRGFWVLSRHEDIVTVSKDHQQFSSQRGTELSSPSV